MCHACLLFRRLLRLFTSKQRRFTETQVGRMENAQFFGKLSQPSHNDGIGRLFKSLAEQGESGVTAGRGAKRRGLRLRPFPTQSPAEQGE